MTDYMDGFSIPTEVVDHGLVKLFYMPPRQSPGKEGRTLLVNFDGKMPLVKGFKVNYSYSVVFHERGNVAGNHYHLIKNELMIPQCGSFRLTVEDIETKEQLSLVIASSDDVIAYVRSKVSHSVEALQEEATLLVLATSANNDGDEYDYEINLKK